MRVRKAILVDRDPALLARLTAELARSGVETETLASTEGLTPDLLALAGPDFLVLDAELPGLTSAALLVIVRSMKARLPLLATAVSTSREPLLKASGGIDQVVPRAALEAEGGKALGFFGPTPTSVDVRAIIDSVLGSAPAADALQPLAANLDLFSDHNFWLGRGTSGQVLGVFIATSVLPSLAQSVPVRLELMGREVIEASGEVAWQRTRKSLVARQPPGVGVRLTALSPEARASIERFMQLREPFIWNG